MHEQQVVHGDLKPDNVMVQRAGAELLTAKLIDLDEAYVVGQPPSPDHIVGDPSYYSPELLRYIKRDERLPADALTTASDMFSFGLLIHTMLVGDQPMFERGDVNYPAEALLSRRPLDISNAPAALQPMIARMVALIPSNRPSIDEFIEFLSDIDADAMVPVRYLTVSERAPRTAPRPAPARPSSPARPSAAPRPTPATVPGRTPPRSPASGSDSGGGGGLRSTMGRRPRPESPSGSTAP